MAVVPEAVPLLAEDEKSLLRLDSLQEALSYPVEKESTGFKPILLNDGHLVRDEGSHDLQMADIAYIL
jgi:hypothetical protein